MATASQERKMFATHAMAQHADNAKLLLLVIAAGIVVCWRIALRVLFAMALIAAGVGAIVLLEAMHR
jgi:hypothetical protein